MKNLLKIILYTILSRFIVRRGAKDSIYITFDDGPSPDNTIRILDVLARHSVNATFFMTGAEMMKYQDIVRRVSSAGHQIAYHGYSHNSMKKQNMSAFSSDIKQALKLEKLFDIKLNLYRPPYGDISFSGFIYLMFGGWKIIMWSLDSRDSFDTEEQILCTVAATQIRPGEIILFHDDYTKTANILDSVLTDYATHSLKTSAIH